jgi:hypothetical protein
MAAAAHFLKALREHNPHCQIIRQDEDGAVIGPIHTLCPRACRDAWDNKSKDWSAFWRSHDAAGDYPGLNGGDTTDAGRYYTVHVTWARDTSCGCNFWALIGFIGLIWFLVLYVLYWA